MCCSFSASVPQPPPKAAHLAPRQVLQSELGGLVRREVGPCAGNGARPRDLVADAETLGELDYWTPAVHKAAFALPAFVARRMSPSAPPAPPTSDES